MDQIEQNLSRVRNALKQRAQRASEGGSFPSVEEPSTRFGRRAVGDPRFVLDLRLGRRPRRRTLERVETYLVLMSMEQRSQR